MTCWMYRVDGGAWMPWSEASALVGSKLNNFGGRDSYTTRGGHVVERAEQPRELAVIMSARLHDSQVAVLDGEVMTRTRAASEVGCKSKAAATLARYGVVAMTAQEALGWLGVRREAVRRGVGVTPKGYLAARARWEQSRSKAGV